MFTPDARLPESATGDAIWLITDTRKLLVEATGDSVGFPVGEAPVGYDGDRTLVGVLRGQPVWTIDTDEFGDPHEGAELADLRSLFGRIDDELWPIAGRAVQLVAFNRSHRFCGQCGNETQDHHRDRAKHCEPCGQMAFPRLAPAVIMLVERNDDPNNDPAKSQVLLAWGRQFPGRFFSALAGFVEPGESLEETVHREVREEVGLEVTDVTYFGSQPWPFPHSLMLGFTAKYVSGDIVCQEDEIVEANWYSVDDLPPVPRGRMSIAGWLIEDWIERASGTKSVL